MTMIPHADIVGSLLRPAELISARERFASGQLTGAGFEQIENRAVDQAIAIQQESGLDVIIYSFDCGTKKTYSQAGSMCHYHLLELMKH